MNRTTFDAMLAQYKKQDVSGAGAVSWDKGVHCVLPEVLVYGKAVQDGTPTPDAPVMPEFGEGTTVVCRGKNLFDADAALNDVFTKDGDVYTILRGEEGSRFSKAVKCYIPANTYFACRADVIECAGVFVIPDLQVALSMDDGSSFTLPVDGAFRVRTRAIVSCQIYADSGDSIGSYKRFRNFQIEITTKTPYVPYFDGGSATAPELLAIPGTEYRDEWDAQTGKGVRRVSKLVLDGTETRWTATNRSVFDYNVPFASYAVNSSDDVTVSPIVCSHYGAISHYHANMNIQHGVSFYQKALSFSFGDGEVYTVDTWKAYLAAQYAAGTPVTVWYALKEPIPFQTAPAPLIAPKGTGHIMQVGGNLDGCPITAKPVTHS